ncbi:MoaD/ThiS family protein [Thermococcus sp. LS2]|uniref:MoaD/ThiS family protein n=1 Tax=Thermococcus sp. LS2 TaxID=1638260 RepID=UPI0014398436|nr:MoaD family protein [Thermococcus sp. LS2]NJE13169.1 MoaD family protein [Thermococcus sp. LS2]
MKTVHLMYAGKVSEITGKLKEDIKIDDECTVYDLLKKLTMRYTPGFKKEVFDPEKAETMPDVIILINGSIVRDFNKKLNDGDFVSILQAVSGG